jgi:hypothetical protein
MTQTLMSRPATHVVEELGERCDRCGVAAKLRQILTAGGELTFCGHHANRYSETIAGSARAVVVESGFAWRGAA